ncbi:hypothetical protein [Shewanella algae]|uniref:hypothetical protein n=1 Tax=Shewanella algae TaxID=38313 RepID=UPI0031F5C85D
MTKFQQEQQSLHHETVLLAQQLELLSEKVAALEAQKHAAEALAAPSAQVQVQSQNQAPTQVQTSSEEPPAAPKPTSGVDLDTATDSADIPATDNQTQSNNKNGENR